MSGLDLTVVCEAPAADDATQMALVLGWFTGSTPDEWIGAFTPRAVDAEGREYRYFSLRDTPEHVIDGLRAMLAYANLPRPPQDVPDETGRYQANMAAANRAWDAARLNVWLPVPPDPDTGEMPPNPVPQLGDGRIVAVAGMRGADALAALGLTPVGRA